MDQTTDLDAALKFVIGRIEEQASQSGKPLNHEQRLLLSYLPSSISTIVFASDPTFLVPVPRDINYETVRALGKAAYLKDLGQSRVTLEWEFASAVFKLNRHPMWSLLQQAGVRDRRPWWDQFLVVIAALLFIGIAMAIALLLGFKPWTTVKWVEFGFAYMPLAFLMYLGSRRIERWQLEKEIERCRSEPRLTSR